MARTRYPVSFLGYGWYTIVLEIILTFTFNDIEEEMAMDSITSIIYSNKQIWPSKMAHGTEDSIIQNRQTKYLI